MFYLRLDLTKEVTRERDVRLIGLLSESEWTSVRAGFKAHFGSD